MTLKALLEQAQTFLARVRRQNRQRLVISVYGTPAGDTLSEYAFRLLATGGGVKPEMKARVLEKYRREVERFSDEKAA